MIAFSFLQGGRASTRKLPECSGPTPASALRLLCLAITVARLLSPSPAHAQSVLVSIGPDKSAIAVGETTTLRVTAQVISTLRPRAQQIFSWHLDLVQEFADPVELTPASLARPASDQHPTTSSGGSLDGNTLRGIYDTLAGIPTAGVANPVLLLTVPVKGRKEGTAVFRVKAGSGPANLSSDFLVAGINPEEFWTGGIYSATNATATVVVRSATLEAPKLTITLDPGTSGSGATIRLDFPVAPSRTYSLQSTARLGPDALWQNLPGAPHNTGRATEPLGPGSRFYRVMVTD